jgi:NtrC-family two-component system sensor histidine kinase KinB
MRIHRLQTRFLLAGGLLVTATVVGGAWSALTFARLGAMVDRTLHESQETIDLAALAASALEREDDAVLLALTGNVTEARKQRLVQQQQFEDAYQRLLPLMHDPEEQEAAAALRRHADQYRAAGDALLAAAGQATANQQYHDHVNPVLRQAVAECAKIRELNFQSMGEASIQARDEAQRATVIVALLSGAALLLSIGVAVRLARTVLRPVRELALVVEALRQGHFDRRVPTTGTDELGQLAEGFNRLAEHLTEYRRSSLGELLTAKLTLEATLNTLPDAVIVVEPDGPIAAMNPPARALLEATGHGTASRLTELPLSAEHLAAVTDALQGQRSSPGRTEFKKNLVITLNGMPRNYSLQAVPIPEFEPHRFGAVIVLEDVTDFERLDDLRKELIAVASHELKTPLTTLRMNLLLLDERTENLSPRQREMLATAVQGSEELGATIDELLDLTRIEAEQLRLAQAPVDVQALIDRTIQSLQPRFDDAAIAVAFVHAAKPFVVHGDAARLGIVFSNILTNALKYTPHGGNIQVQVASGQNAEADSRPYVRIAVTDSGPGIPEEFRQRVFEKFFRVEHHRPDGADGVRGAGIGLYLCRQIIEAHGGSIWCKASAAGQGTCMVMRLPCEL